MLFRYSAVTFNGHRIHYDEPYTTRPEGYPGQVVHGPMIATLMCRAFINAHPDKQATSLSYRGLRPLLSPRPFTVGGTLGESSEEHTSELRSLMRISYAGYCLTTKHRTPTTTTSN